MGEILKIHELPLKLKNLRENNKIGLITGCFDLIHLGHIELFRFAKQTVDILIVGIDTDDSIHKTKGDNRPILNQNERAQILSELTSVNYVLLLENLNSFFSTNEYYENLTKKIKPHFLITTKSADSYWELKKARIEKFGGSLLLYEKPITNSTTEIINKIKNY